MVARSHAGPLAATISERILAKPEISVIRRRPVLVAEPSPPEPNKAESKETAEVPNKKAKRWTRRPPALKAKIVKEVLKGRADGTATIASVGKAHGVSVSVISTWLKQAGKVNTARKKKVTARRVAAPEGDLGSVTSELTTAMAHVEKLKKQLIALLKA